MARYRWLQDGYVGTTYYYAGDIASTADVGGSLPANFIPPAAVDPLDNAAVTAFYAQGPQATVLVRPQWTGQAAVPAVTYWKPTGLPPPAFGANGLTSWQLTGLGANLPTIVI